MGLFGSLFTGVSALFGQSQATAIISNNIANVNTTGFKRAEAAFESLVTTESRSSTYSPGTVIANRILRIDQQGAIQQTSSSTDASISGNGFFPVKRSVDNLQEFIYTRAGQFSEDSQGLLRNASGFALYGWPIDTDGNLPANQGDLTSLVPIDVAFLGGLTRPTSNAELAINLDADEADVTDSTAINGTNPADFTRGLTMFDSLGASQPLTFQFTKVYGPEITNGGTITGLTQTQELVSDLGLSDGDQFTVTTELGTQQFTIRANATLPGEIQTVNDLITGVNAIAGAQAYLGNAGELVIQNSDFTGGGGNSLFMDNDFGTPLVGLGLVVMNPAQTSNDLNTVDYDNGLATDSPPYSTGAYPTLRYLPGDAQYNSRGWWNLEIIHPDGTRISNGMINFNGDGTLNALSDAEGEIDIELSQIDWGNGSELQDIEIDISRFSQFSGNYDVIFSDQNGAELGLRTGVEIDRDGVVIARFSNGASAELYKIPLITFANSNGLGEVSGTAFSETQASGEENLREAGNGGAGFVEPSTLEASNVDLADEFARLIIAQRAFGAATRTINTVDQMTQDLLSLRG